MDALVLVSLGAVGGLLGVVAIALLAAVVILSRKLDGERSINDKLRANTVTREKLLTEAQERQARVALLRGIFRDSADMLDRECPGAVKQELRDLYPHLFVKKSIE